MVSGQKLVLRSLGGHSRTATLEKRLKMETIHIYLYIYFPMPIYNVSLRQCFNGVDGNHVPLFPFMLFPFEVKWPPRKKN